MWYSVHINDIQPARANRPEISKLRGLAIQSLFERDPDVQALITAAKLETEEAEQQDTVEERKGSNASTATESDNEETEMEIDQSDEEEREGKKQVFFDYSMCYKWFKCFALKLDESTPMKKNRC